jgi:hypothetical protein
MNQHSIPPHWLQPDDPRPQNGAALIITLAFVVLLTVLVVAYFSYSSLQMQISNANANQAAVDIFAQGAIQTITRDLKQEIASGSTATAYGTNTVYYPTSPTNMVPVRIGTDDALPNLVKRSMAATASYPGGVVRAMALSSTNASQNGRSISLARWNAALLLPKANPSSATDLSPTNKFTPPDWIVVARDGSNPTSWVSNQQWSRTNLTTVVGRYAYAIYDEGGTLDVNVAGYPPDTASTSALVNLKGGLPYADITVIPGMTTTAASAIVGWRNAASSQPSGTFPAYTFNTTSQTNYFQTIQSNVSGFLRTSNTNLLSGQSDRQFVSRQQLIQFLTQGVAGSTAEKANYQNALQYLGTFTRDLEQPSFRPDPNRPKNLSYSNEADGGNDAYSTDGSLQDKVNPSLLSVRDSNNLPVMKRRFPLSRLAILEQAGKLLRNGQSLSSSQTQQILDYFGLTWDSANNHWVYNHGGDYGQIYSLVDVPGTREPDFFETLRSVIHCDSLGKQNGGLDSNNSTRTAGSSSVFSPHYYKKGSTSSTAITPALIDGYVNYQIVQIAANLIDQYDADSYPICIYWPTSSSTGWEICGVENLPYFNGWQATWYRTKALTPGVDINTTLVDSDTPISTITSSGTTYETAVMIQPILWNPHAPDTARTSVPTQFRIIASDMVDSSASLTIHPQVLATWWNNDKTHSYSSYPATSTYASANSMTATGSSLFSYPEASLNPSTCVVNFTSQVADTTFLEPYRLRMQTANTTGYYTLTVSADPTLLSDEGGSGTVIGFYCGKAWAGPSTTTISTSTTGIDNNKWLSQGNLNRDFKLRMQYQSPSGDWITYDSIYQVYNTASRYSTIDNTNSQRRGFHAAGRADPRTNRWGLGHYLVYPSTSISDVPSGIVRSYNGVDVDLPLYLLPQGITWKPSATSTYIHATNPSSMMANGWLLSNSLVNFGDLMVTLFSTTENSNCGAKTNATPGAKFYYTDPDGVIRRSSGGNFSGNDGLPMYTGNYTSRPVILNRPFRSIAEMGYAFRGQAWRDVDFFMPESGDSALLDAFCLNELSTAPDDLRVAGRVNLNTRQTSVLQAVISGVSKAEGGILTSTECQKAAQALVNWTMDTTSSYSGILTKGPLRNRSELVGKFIAQVKAPSTINLTGSQDPILDPVQSYSGFSSMLTASASGVFSSSSDASIKRRRECVMRALADSGNTRTWNLLIDLVSQTGRYPAGATGPGNFVVEGEVRYWVHLAIDRFTGQIVDRQVEPVSE